MIRASILIVIMIIIIMTLQLTVLPRWQLDHYVNLLLVLAIMTSLMVGVSKTRWWIVAMAAAVDSFSVLPFGPTLVSYVVAVLAVSFFASHWLTNRSLPTVALLLVIGTLVQFAVLTLSLQTLYWFNLTDLNITLTGSTFSLIISQMFFNSLLGIILFFTTRAGRLTRPSAEQHL